MNRLLIILLFSLFCISASAQLAKLRHIEKVKSSKLVVGLTGNDTIDAQLKTALQKFWTLAEIAEYVPLSDAWNKGDYVLYFEEDVRKISVSTEFDKALPEITMYIPYLDGGAITQECFLFAVAAMQYVCDVMQEKDFKTIGFKWNEVFNNYSYELKGKTLYLLENYLSSGLKDTEINVMYPYPYKIVTYDEWCEAVSTYKEDVAYSVIVPFPDNNFVHFIVEASTGKILGNTYSATTISEKVLYSYSQLWEE